jgi:hypothetical protein
MVFKMIEASAGKDFGCWSRPRVRVWFTLATTALLGCGGSLRAAGEERVFEEVDSIPTRLMTGVDEVGETWQINGKGYVEHSGESLFNQAQLLVVKGTEFSTETLSKAENENHWRLQGTVDKIEVERDVLFDADRGGVRYLESFKNPGDETTVVAIELRSRFRYHWQHILSAQGRDFDGKLGVRDAGLYVKMSEDAQHQGALFLVSGERSAHMPGIETSDTTALTIKFTLSIPAGETRSLVHWVAVRRLTDTADIKEVARDFYRQRLLTDAQIPRDAMERIVNFDLDSDGLGDEEPHDERLLVALNELKERLNVIRTGSDVMWVSRDSQLTGVLTGDPLTVRSRFGEVTVALEDIAAIQGGGGRGRQEKLFLRDGSVVVVDSANGSLSLKGADGWELELDLPQVEYIFARIGKEDGRVVSGTDTFVQFHDGSVCGVAASKEGGPSRFVTPWGPLEIPRQEIVSMTYMNTPSPRHRLLLKDGSRLTVFPVSGAVTVKSPRFGAIDISAGEIAGLWTAEGEVLEIPEDAEIIEEIPEGREGAVCLLTGNNLVSGRLADSTLNVVSGTTVTPLETREILTMTRSYDNDSEILPVFEIELRQGDVLLGTLRDDTVTVESKHASWSVPVQQFMALKVPLEDG